MTRRQNSTPVTEWDRITTTIREQILSGQLRPGDQLPTGPDLAAQYQVSLHTARGALIALASEGLLSFKRGVSGGTFITVPSSERISGLLQRSLALMVESAHGPVSGLVEIREILEAPAAELAALRRTEEDIAEIRGSLFDPRTMDVSEIFTCSQRFHVGVIKAAHNPWLELLADPVQRVLEERFVRDRTVTRFWKKVDGEHREILSKIESGDHVGAGETARSHLRSLRRTYEQIDRQHPPPD